MALFTRKDIDMRLDLKLLRDAVSKKNSFQNTTPKQDAEFIQRRSEEVISFISQFLAKDATYVHYTKKQILYEAITKLDHLKSIARYAKNYNDPAQTESLSIELDTIERMFSTFSSGGVVYLVRHCDKEKRFKLNDPTKAYDGIASKAIRNQAMKLADEIYDEIRISSKPVKIIIRTSEQDRTRIFGEIILHRVGQLNQLSENKVIIEAPQFDQRIQMKYWSNEALAEVKEPFKKGEGYVLESWWEQKNEFDPKTTTFKYQPAPSTIAANVVNFMENMYSMANSDPSHYTIVIGISHSFVIDTLILTLIPSIKQSIPGVIATAGFIKKECGQYGYLGKWI